MSYQILSWEVLGIVFIFVLGSLIHSSFDWLGRWRPIAIFVPVNESVWEHLKLGFWPSVLFSIIEYHFIKDSVFNFFLAKAVSVFLITIIILILHYVYMYFVGHHVVVLDILIFSIAIAIGQIASYVILTLGPLPKIYDGFGMLFLTIFALSLIWFTFTPPHLTVFKNPYTGGYGL